MRSILAALCLALLTLARPAAAQLHDSFQGQLLVAGPGNLDPRFHRAVVYMVKHTPKTAYGIIVNKPAGKENIGDLMKGLGLGPSEAKTKLPLHYGGPVAPEYVFILHTSDFDHARGEYIDGAITFTKDVSVLKKFADGEGPRRVFVALGYAGWRGGQLEGEVERGYWTVAPSSEEHVFGDNKETLWRRIFGKSALPL